MIALILTAILISGCTSISTQERHDIWHEAIFELQIETLDKLDRMESE